jgi:polygalacturonase
MHAGKRDTVLVNLGLRRNSYGARLAFEATSGLRRALRAFGLVGVAATAACSGSSAGPATNGVDSGAPEGGAAASVVAPAGDAAASGGSSGGGAGSSGDGAGSGDGSNSGSAPSDGSTGGSASGDAGAAGTAGAAEGGAADATVARDAQTGLGPLGDANAGGADANPFLDGGGLPWPAANQILSEIVQPTFPSAMFSVTDYGAVGDGQTDNTAAFQQAIAACSAAGGGHVVVPAGTFVTGAITLLSNVDLHLASPMTTLQFSADVTKYPTVLTRFRGTELMNHSPMVYAYGQQNIGLTGSGVLDASKTAAWQMDMGDGVNLVTSWGQNGTPVAQRVMPAGSNLRVTYVEPYDCQNVLIQGVTINNGQFWNIHPTLSQNVTVDGVTIHATAQETDGCDPESSDHVVIENVNFSTGDDDVAIKSGRDNDGRRLHTPTTNVVVQHVTFAGNYGILALGSEESGGIAHIFGYDMTAVDNHTLGVGRVFQYTLFMKANWDRGGVVDDIHLDSVKMYNISGPIVYGDMTYDDITTGMYPPTFGNIFMSNIAIAGAQQVFDVFATPTNPFGAITLDDCTFTNVTDTTNTLTDVDPAPVLTNVTVNGQLVQ